MTNNVVRVAVNNNFNCTEKEYHQLDTFQKNNPNRYFFINCNIKTPKLLNINKHPYKAVITINPDLMIQDNLVQRLYAIDSSKVAFVRIKYIPGWDSIVHLIAKISETHNVVITLQRFNSIKSISQYVPDFRKHYKHSCNRFRLSGGSFEDIEALVHSLHNTYICDQSGMGCEGCGLCSRLTIGLDLPVYTLNLSSSGECPYSCIDCYAKTMQHFLKKINMPQIRYDHIHQNHKQSGKTTHIKRAKLKKTS